MVDWPVSLAGVVLVSGVSDGRVGARIRSDVDVGPALVRRRYTTAVRNVSIPVDMTDTEYLAFLAFWIDDLDEGTLQFNWTDPVTKTTLSFRFRGTDQPVMTQYGGSETTRWAGTFDLEILP